MQDHALESRLLSLLTQPMRLDELRRALPEAGKQEVKDALDRLTADGAVMKNKKNRFAVSAHYGCAAGTYLATERAFAFVAPDVLNTARVHQNFQQSGFQFGVCFFIFHIRPSYLRLLAKNYPL